MCFCIINEFFSFILIMIMLYKIGIVGSSHASAEFFVPYVRDIVTPFIKVNGFSIVSGGAKGADSAAKIVAEELGVPIKEYLPDFKEHPNWLDAFRARNKLIAENSTEVWSLTLPYKNTQCVHCKRAGKDSLSHEKTGGCWTGSMKGKWEVLVCRE